MPAHSPDLNLIEKAFSKLNALACRKGNRTVAVLEDFLGNAVDCYSPEECANDDQSCGYATTTWEPLELLCST